MTTARTALFLTIPSVTLLVFAGAPTQALEPDCDETLGLLETVAASPDEIHATLVRLHAVFADLPRFIDVYYHPEQAVAYRPLFVLPVPDEAYARPTEVAVEFDTLLEEPKPLGPGPVPTTNDVLCSGIRPGSMVTVGGSICTLSFVFTDGTNTYISTAGHCINTGQTASVPNVGVMGTAVFSTGDGGAGTDFALIRVNANRLNLVSAEMCFWAGPTGTVAPGVNILGEPAYQVGHGYGFINLPPRPRVGVGGSQGATSFSWIGPGFPGDSGSPVRLDTLAMGVNTHGGSGLNMGTPVWRGLELASAAGFNLQLVTVPYVHPV